MNNRFRILNIVVSVTFFLGIIQCVFRDRIFNDIEASNYIFWLSMGVFIGFKGCKYVYRKYELEKLE